MCVFFSFWSGGNDSSLGLNPKQPYGKRAQIAAIFCVCVQKRAKIFRWFKEWSVCEKQPGWVVPDETLDPTIYKQLDYHTHTHTSLRVSCSLSLTNPQLLCHRVTHSRNKTQVFSSWTCKAAHSLPLEWYFFESNMYLKVIFKELICQTKYDVPWNTELSRFSQYTFTYYCNSALALGDSIYVEYVKTAATLNSSVI